MVCKNKNIIMRERETRDIRIWLAESTRGSIVMILEKGQNTICGRRPVGIALASHFVCTTAQKNYKREKDKTKNKS